MPLTSRLLNRVLTLLAGLTMTRQTALAASAFGYALLMGTEGIALYLRKPWARWFTIIATSSLIPLEVYEIARRPHHGTGGEFSSPNVAIVAVSVVAR